MTKQEKNLLLILIIIAATLSYCWLTILFTEIEAMWRHYVGIILFIPLIVLFKKDFKKAVLFTGIYLVLGTFNLLSFTLSVRTNSFELGYSSIEISTPTFQLYSLILLVLYFILNSSTLVNYYLDYKDVKKVEDKKVD